ncbi:MAG: HIT family protein [Chloroflexi bacterium]|nr:HIT family protein [Chloroflexota bacterium]
MADNQTQCVFCDIVAGKLAAYKISEDDFSFAILDINPLAQGHCLVIPKRHVRLWNEMTEQETSSLFNLARVVANKMVTLFKPEFVVPFARGRRIPHAHLFLLPTKAGDTLDAYYTLLERVAEGAPELTRIRAEAEMDATARMLREAEEHR